MAIPKRSYWFREVVTEQEQAIISVFVTGREKSKNCVYPMTSIWHFGDWNLTKGKLRVGITATGSFRKLWRKL